MTDTLLIEAVEKAYAACSGNLRGDRKLLSGFATLLVPEEKNGYWRTLVRLLRCRENRRASPHAGHALPEDIIYRHQTAIDAAWDADETMEIHAGDALRR